MTVKNMKYKKYKMIYLTILFLGACSKTNQHPNQVPQSWYNSDAVSNNDSSTTGTQKEELEESKELNQSITNLLIANSEAIEGGDKEVEEQALYDMNTILDSPVIPRSKPPTNMKPKDWVPWRAEYVMTDLSLTGSGLIGALAFKGTSTVRSYWRKQGPKPEKETQLNSDTFSAQDDVLNKEPVIVVNEMTTAEEMVKQIEPAIQTAVASGKIKDTPVLRSQLLQTAREFQSIAMVIPDSGNDLPWWVSRFRLDFSIDAAGRVEPVGMVGGEVRFRFEWFRIKRINKIANVINNITLKKQNLVLSEREQKIRKSLMDFINATSMDLSAAFENHNDFGFKAHQIRMGIGISVKGNIGIVKGSAGVVGQIYFNRNVERPIIYPDPIKALSHLDEEISQVLIIEKNPTSSNLQLAKKNQITFEAFSSENNNDFEEAIYKLDRKKFRQGLKKASNISAYFAKRASEVKFKKWKIYELRTAFDASISGGLDLVTLVGSVTAQVSLFNENF